MESLVIEQARFRAQLGFATDEATIRRHILEFDHGTKCAQPLYGSDAEIAELDARTDMATDLSNIQTFLASTEPDAFAGVYIDNASGKGIVRYVGEAPDIPWWNVRHQNRIELRPASHSLRELESAQAAVRDQARVLHTMAVDLTAVSISIPTNQLEIEVKGDLGIAREELAGAVHVSFSIRSGEPANPGSQNPSADAVAGIGGSLGFGCTLAYHMYQAGTWNIYALTAGHCPNAAFIIGYPRFLALGFSGADMLSFNTNADIQAHTSSWNFDSGYVKWGSGYFGVQSLAQFGGTGDIVGQAVCNSGQYTISCGVIDTTHLDTFNSGWVALLNQRRAGYACVGGDSGGAVFSYQPNGAVIAVGVNWQGNGSGPSQPAATPCAYSHARYALNAFGLTDVIKYWDS